MEHTLPQNINFITAFFAGFLSFLSPCVLPLIPGYISFISGASLKELQDTNDLKKVKKDVMWTSLAFVIGFSSVFIALGASATFLGRILLQHLDILSKIAGFAVIILGLHLTGIFKIKTLYREKRIRLPQKRINLFESFLLGLAFAFGWTPCIGPILAGILALAATQTSMGQGLLLLSFYSMGLAIPFMLAAASITLFLKSYDRIKKYFSIIEWTAGILLIIIGLLMITGGLVKITVFFQSFIPTAG
ncbi:MAG: cytochrome c biogenesis CcdA family protein [Candidatus Goldiibacteriota bacterium]